MNMQQHWENVYKTKKPNEVSWTQPVPQTSLELIRALHLPRTASIIDIGGGESTLVDHLLNEDFENITVLDISSKALDKTKQRLGAKAEKVKWIVNDITEFNPDTTYDLWHDRATFHFLTTPTQINKYIDIASNAVKGFLTIGTFSENGPTKCSGLPITQYNEEGLSALMQNGFEKIKCITEDHTTPFNTKQNFLFCTFKKTVTKNS